MKHRYKIKNLHEKIKAVKKALGIMNPDEWIYWSVDDLGELEKELKEVNKKRTLHVWAKMK